MNTIQEQPTVSNGRVEPPACSDEGVGIGEYPLSFAQEGLWFLEQYAPGIPAYNVPEGWWISGPLDRIALEKSLEAVCRRQEALRTGFRVINEKPTQVIFEEPRLQFRFVDASEAANPRATALMEAEAEVKIPFDLKNGTLFRALLVRLGEEEHLVVFTLHHIVSDAWSVGILLREIAAQYRAYVSGAEAALPELTIQFPDYCEWQRQVWQRGLLKEQQNYWQAKLGAPLSTVDLPKDFPRPSIQTFKGATQFSEWPSSLAEKLRSFSREHGVTLFTTLLTAFKVLLHRYTRQDDIIVGSPFAGRERLETEALIGFFANTLPLRTNLDGNPSFSEALQRVRETVVEAQGHSDMPLEKMVAGAAEQRDLRRSSIFQVVFGLQGDFVEGWSLPKTKTTRLELETGTAKFDWTILATESKAGLRFRSEFSTDLFKGETISRLMRQLQVLVEGILENPNQRIGELSLLTPTEKEQLLENFNQTARDYERDQTVTQVFEARVSEGPTAIALVCGKEQLTYAELDNRADRLSAQLRSLGVRPGAMVGICLERSPELVISLLAILKTGGTYVPLEASYPEERLQFMLKDTGTQIVITGRKHLKVLGQSQAQLVVVEELMEGNLDSAQESVRTEIEATAPAYVIYTSGSTGVPKGVAVPHRAIVRLVRNTNYVTITREDIFLQLAPVSFDASTFEIWGALLNGAKLVMFPPHMPSLEELGRVISDEKISILWLTAGLFHQMIDEQIASLSGVQQLLAGGEALSVNHVKRAIGSLKQTRIINGYGPTENTTFTCCYSIPADWTGGTSVPIGKPIANTQVYILDTELKPVPLGMPGELFTGGDGLALGYVNRPELTASKFVKNPFANDASCERLYRTGDLARWNPDGTIEFLGRLDEQLKVRGYRVEPGEIEATLVKHPAVSNAAVITKADKSGNRHLVAYLVPLEEQTLSLDEIRNFASSKLPPYMVPSDFVMLKSFPLTANGKIDRRALPDPNYANPESQGTTIEPIDETEERLLHIWTELLGKEKISTDTNFFHLGGHSLLATQVISRVGKSFGVELPVRAIFEAPTISKLAREITQAQQAGWVEAPEIQPNATGARAAELLARLDELSDEEVEKLLQETN